jgi:hypothetical protein
MYNTRLEGETVAEAYLISINYRALSCLTMIKLYDMLFYEID